MAKNRDKKAFTALDLFSGCGGLTLGLKNAGFKVLGAVEIDPLAAETYAANHPEVKLWAKSICRITGPQIRRALKIRKGELDLLAGCPPCQGFSSMRTRNGNKRVRDRRNDLVFDYLRLVKALRPKTVMLENVPALATNVRMKRLKKTLQNMGYDLQGTPTILNAANFGVPQRRRRMMLICSRIGQIQLPKGQMTKKTVRQAIGALPIPGKSHDPLHDLKVQRDPRILQLIKHIPKDGGSRASLPKKFRLECHMKLSSGFADVYGRMKWSDISPTITSGCVNPSKGRFLHPTQNRAITLREAALLQTFPRKYQFSLRRGRYAAALMIGNALPPIFIKKHAHAIKMSLLAAR